MEANTYAFCGLQHNTNIEFQFKHILCVARTQ